MLGAMRKTKKCEKYGILYGHLELRHSREALLEGCVEVDSPVFFARRVSLVHSVIRILSFLHNAVVSFIISAGKLVVTFQSFSLCVL